ncbi:Sensor protein EvgS precursor [Aquimixticola soesokkakensis]|uniref:Sensor protein EvgS n=1 Tax=Aquimixticola soesokkakensis TaxID=1519096 RepID=A0A1Y5TMZ4_9RHOB|nr:response regulator [Aquimixticola soesokkakensis]SLN67380.1 Sensor protein EvgS precursor [Aquimixticola soesokkakensis]
MTQGEDIGAALQTTDTGRFTLLAHDIRSAMTDVIMGLRFFHSEDTTVRGMSEVTRLRMTSEHLARLLEEALFLVVGEKLDGPELSDPIPLREMVENMGLRWRKLAKSAGCCLTVAIADDLPEHAVIDRLEVERILSNFLANAIRHGGPGQVTLFAQASPEGIELGVRDKGPGFPKDLMSRLAALPEPIALGVGEPGSGFGLRIVREMAARMGAKLDLFNRPEGGGEARLTVPNRIPASTESEQSADPSQHRLDGLRILIADDIETNRFMMAEIIRELGGDCVLVGDGLAALEALEDEKFDLAILDMEMPLFTGLEVIRFLRGREGPVAQTPIIALSAYIFAPNRQAIMQAGAQAILSKPILSTLRLWETIQAALGRGYQSDPQGRPSPLPFPEKPVKIDDPMTAQRRARLNKLASRLTPESRATFLERLESDLSSAAEALNEALARGDNKAVARVAHVLSSLFGTCATDAERENAQRLLQDANVRNITEIIALGRSVGQNTQALVEFVKAIRLENSDCI